MLFGEDKSGDEPRLENVGSTVTPPVNRLSAVEVISLSDADSIRQLVEMVVAERGKPWNDYMAPGALPADVVITRKEIVGEVINIVAGESHNMVSRLARIKELINIALNRLEEKYRMSLDSRRQFRGVLGGPPSGPVNGFPDLDEMVG